MRLSTEVLIDAAGACGVVLVAVALWWVLPAAALLWLGGVLIGGAILVTLHRGG